MKLFLPLSILLVLLNTYCAPKKQDEKKEPVTIQSIDTIAAIFNRLSNDSLTILLNRSKKFAENYKPVSNSEFGIATLTNIPDSIVYSFRQLRLHSNNEYVKYLTLILVRVYRTHLKCCHQGYEMRNKPSGKGIDSIADPLLYEFNLISKTFENNKPIEFINSGIGHSWLEENKQLLKYDRLKKEYEEIEKIGDGILREPNKYY